MSFSGRTAGIVAVFVLLSGCGAVGDGCSGIEMETEHDDLFSQLRVSVRNTSDEPKLVTLAIVDRDGLEINSQTLRVDAKDIAQTAVGNMRNADDADVEIVRCE